MTIQTFTNQTRTILRAAADAQEHNVKKQYCYLGFSTYKTLRCYLTVQTRKLGLLVIYRLLCLLGLRLIINETDGVIAVKVPKSLDPLPPDVLARQWYNIALLAAARIAPVKTLSTNHVLRYKFSTFREYSRGYLRVPSTSSLLSIPTRFPKSKLIIDSQGIHVEGLEQYKILDKSEEPVDDRLYIRCRKCGETYHSSEFSRDANNYYINKKNIYCKQCAADISAKYRNKNKLECYERTKAWTDRKSRLNSEIKVKKYKCKKAKLDVLTVATIDKEE